MEGQNTERMLRENLELARENNRLLKKIRRASILGGILKIIWWALILGLPVYLYFTFAQPYVEQAQQTYESARTSAGEVSGMFGQLKSLLQQYGISVQ